MPYCSFSAKLAHWGGGIVTGPQQKTKNTRYAWYAENCAKHSEWGKIEPKIIAGCGILRAPRSKKNNVNPRFIERKALATII